jgi:hypothetical protein
VKVLYLDPAIEPAKFVPIDISPDQHELEELIGGEIYIVPLSGKLAAVVHKDAACKNADLPCSVVLAGPSGKIRHLNGPVVLVRRGGDKLLPVTKADEVEYGGCRTMLTESYA